MHVSTHLLLIALICCCVVVQRCFGAAGFAQHASNDLRHGTAVEQQQQQFHRRARVGREFAAVQPSVDNVAAPAADALLPEAQVALDGHGDDSAAGTTPDSAAVPAARELGDLLHMDTNKFSEKQKQLFKKIVERVARVSGLAASEQQQLQLQQQQQQQAEAASQQQEELGDIDDDDSDDDDDSAESVRLIPAIEEGRDSKVRQTKVKYTAGGKSGAATTIKVRPRPTTSSPPQADIGSGIADKHKYKLIVNAASGAAHRPVASSVATKTDNYTEVIFGNITTTSIVDSLQASEQQRETAVTTKTKKRPPTTAQAMTTADTVAVAAAAAGGADALETKKEPLATAKPTKYHYYPHNQHIYLLPECAIQQVCNAVYVRLNYTQPLCACPSRYRDPCSASINEDDLHTTKLIGDDNKKAITLAKTCESTTEMRECRSPRDWSLLALQNTRTGKSHYLVICRCPDSFILEGPMAHDQPTYASVPGIRVFGMMCIKPGAGANRKPQPQIPKRDGIHQYQQQQHVKQPYQQQQQYQQQQIQSQQYNAPQQQQQYQSQQPNYQYLHRATSDRPVPSQSTPRSQSYQQQHNGYQQQFSHSNINAHPNTNYEYDDVYARNGAGIVADEAAAASAASSSSSSSSSSTSSATATAGQTATTYALAASDTIAAAQAAATTSFVNSPTTNGEQFTATAAQSDSTDPTPAAVPAVAEAKSATAGLSAEAEASTATDSSNESAASSADSDSESVADSESGDSSEAAADSATATGVEPGLEPVQQSAAAETQRRKRRYAAEEVEAGRHQSNINAYDDGSLQARLELIVDQLLHSGAEAKTAVAAAHRQKRAARVASGILAQAERQM